MDFDNGRGSVRIHGASDQYGHESDRFAIAEAIEDLDAGGGAPMSTS